MVIVQSAESSRASANGFDFGKESSVAKEKQTPDRKGSATDDNEAGNREFDQFRFTPYTSDEEFFSDPVIHEAGEESRATLSGHEQHGVRNSRSDEEIKDEINRLLPLLDQVEAAGIQVEVDQGTVTLSGEVRDQQDVQKVEKMAGNVLGVSEVRNRLKIGHRDS
jgi:hypothetical protein